MSMMLPDRGTSSHGDGDFSRKRAGPCRRLIADQRGGVAVFLALALIPIVGLMGIATDTARAYIVKSRLSSAVDAASLAGGQNFFSKNRDDDIRMFFKANFPEGYLGAHVNGPKIVVDTDNEKVGVTANATVPTTFMRIFGYDDVDVYAAAEVTRKMQALDVVLSMDISGSMNQSAPGGGRRIDAAKAAANELIDILYGSEASKDMLNIGLVPWSSKVKVMVEGKSYNPALTKTKAVGAFLNPENNNTAQSTVWYANNSPVPLLAEPPADWDGCVFNRYIKNGNDADDGDIRYGSYTGGGANWPGWQPIFPGNHPKWGGEPVSGWKQKCKLSIANEECASCPSVGITPLQGKKAPIKAAVNGLRAGGNTNIPAGLGWAWRVLMPAAPFTEADPNPPYEREQAIVLLTDGENCAYSGDGYKRVFGSCGGGRDEMDDRLKKLAANIKADNVSIYVVQFANQGTALQTLLKQVASGPATPYYHYAPSSSDLKKAFREIANHLSELRLSK